MLLLLLQRISRRYNLISCVHQAMFTAGHEYSRSKVDEDAWRLQQQKQHDDDGANVSRDPASPYSSSHQLRTISRNQFRAGPGPALEFRFKPVPRSCSGSSSESRSGPSSSSSSSSAPDTSTSRLERSVIFCEDVGGLCVCWFSVSPAAANTNDNFSVVALCSLLQQTHTISSQNIIFIAKEYVCSQTEEH